MAFGQFGLQIFAGGYLYLSDGMTLPRRLLAAIIGFVVLANCISVCN